MSGFRSIAVIPARGGSKRLPRKNIVDFHGRPMMSYTIEAAHDCGCFDRIVVSTEDLEIAEVARKFGAEVDARPAKLATDEARVTDLCLELLDRERRAGRTWTTMACLYATAPLRTASDIKATVELLEPDLCDFAMAVSRYPLPPHQALKRDNDGTLSPMWPQLVDLRASDLPELVVDNGSTYVVDCAAFELHKTFFGPKLRGHEMPRQRSIDIDTRDDLEYARQVAADLNCTLMPSASLRP
jgi:pseudaminic acid cytidylyltransferase